MRTSQPTNSRKKCRIQNVRVPATRRPPVNAFVGGPSSQVAVRDVHSPIDNFKEVFDDDVYRIVVDETNRYAHQFLTANPLLPHNSVWPHNVLVSFFGIIFTLQRFVGFGGCYELNFDLRFQNVIIQSSQSVCRIHSLAIKFRSAPPRRGLGIVFHWSGSDDNYSSANKRWQCVGAESTCAGVC